MFFCMYSGQGVKVINVCLRLDIMADKNKVPVEVSRRHVHLSKDVVELLFGKGYSLNIDRYLSQPGQFAAKERVNLRTPGGVIRNVRVLGPERAETQVELARSDAEDLGLDAPVRHSKDIDGTPGLILEGIKGSVEIDKGVIRAKRHIHISDEESIALGLLDGESVDVFLHDSEKLIENISVKVHPCFSFSAHIDSDEADLLGIDRKSVV